MSLVNKQRIYDVTKKKKKERKNNTLLYLIVEEVAIVRRPMNFLKIRNADKEHPVVCISKKRYLNCL